MDEQAPGGKSAKSGGRETFLTVMLLLLLGGGIFFFLNMVTFGFFAYVMLAVLGLTWLGMFHYALWGHALSQEVAGEREEEELRRRMEAENQDMDDRPRTYRDRSWRDDN
jgi:hypothetical protein